MAAVAGILGQLLVAHFAPAAVYFVATSGADTDPGTPEKPFRSIQRAADIVGPGDTVVVRAGIYPESVAIKTSGAPGRLIVFEGERGADGAWLTIVDRSRPVGTWVPAPEIGPGVFKSLESASAPYCMTLDGKQLARIRDDFMASGKGFDLMRLPADAPCGEEMDSFDPRQRSRVKFWDAIEALYAHQGGVTYFRFRNGDEPNGRNLKAAPAGGGFEISDQSHVVIRKFHVRGAANSVVIRGPKARHNVVEENYLAHGRTRVTITDGAAFNLVRNNQMTLNYYGHNDPGAWGAAQPDRRSALRLRVYRVFKHLVGHNSSDDVAVCLRKAGEGNEIFGNHMFNGLIGVSCGDCRSARVYRNVIHNMSSIGILTSEDAGKGAVDGEFFDNLVYDSNINLRIHHYNNSLKGQRREFHYRNLFYEPPGLGSHIYVHWTSKTMEKGAAHPEIYLYHNTFVGGRSGLAISAYAEKDGVAGIMVWNNLFSGCAVVPTTQAMRSRKDLFGALDYNWFGGHLSAPIPPSYGEHNVMVKGPLPWPSEALPDFRLPEDCTARGAGLDLSRPINVGGRVLPPLAGLKPGYFKGPAPDCGALEFGQSAPVPLPPNRVSPGEKK